MTDPCSSPPDSGYPSDCELMEGYRTLARQRTSGQTSPYRKRALARAKDIKLLLLDVDGVLTDGTLIYTGSNEESKSFHTQDGFGIRLLREIGVKVGVITARKSELVQRRAAELKMDYIYQGIPNKIEAFGEIIKSSTFMPFEIAYMGDDWLDITILQRVGLAVVPANGVVEVKEIAHYITELPGGHGAVRDCCDLILEAQNRLPDLLRKYKIR
jgi:3-deoxy-D-manno-octulosonate 8-phosphate phosphatase (KDO 8-P phosphatase)